MNSKKNTLRKTPIKSIKKTPIKSIKKTPIKSKRKTTMKSIKTPIKSKRKTPMKSKRKTPMKSIKTARKSLRKTPKEMEKYSNVVRITNKKRLEQKKTSKKKKEEKNVNDIIEEIENEKKEIKTLFKDIKIENEKNKLKEVFNQVTNKWYIYSISSFKYFIVHYNILSSELFSDPDFPSQFHDIIKSILANDDNSFLYKTEQEQQNEINNVKKQIGYFKKRREYAKDELLPEDVAEGSKRTKSKSKQNKKKNNKRTQNKKRKKKKRTKKNISGSIEKITFKNDDELNDMILNEYERKIDDDYQFNIKFQCGTSPDIGAIYCDGLAEFTGKDSGKYVFDITYNGVTKEHQISFRKLKTGPLRGGKWYYIKRIGEDKWWSYIENRASSKKQKRRRTKR